MLCLAHLHESLDSAGAALTPAAPVHTARAQGLHMMIIVCSFLFPIALQGAKFCAPDGGRAAAIILLANAYAVLLKLAIFDASPFEHSNAGDAVRLHAIRRSRPTSLAFIVSFPASILGIAMAGVGFLAALAPSPDAAAVRWMACGGSALCWGTITLHKALHSPVERRVHYSKVRRRSAQPGQSLQRQTPRSAYRPAVWGPQVSEILNSSELRVSCYACGIYRPMGSLINPR